MPVTIRATVRRISQEEFGELAYSVMGCVFKIHAEMGRFFEEKIYKRELAHRYPGVELEVPIEISHGTFRTLQYIDVLVDGAAPFEFKAVEAISPRHSAQLLNYMMLAELAHGKLVNLRSETVQHEFVNTSLTLKDRRQFDIIAPTWTDRVAGAQRFREQITALLRDWGTGLSLSLYEEAITYFLGGESQVWADVEVRMPDHTLGHQRMRLAAPRVTFVLTGLPSADLTYETHLRRLRRHTELEAILWANIAVKEVTLTVVI